MIKDEHTSYVIGVGCFGYLPVVGWVGRNGLSYKAKDGKGIGSIARAEKPHVLDRQIGFFHRKSMSILLNRLESIENLASGCRAIFPVELA